MDTLFFIAGLSVFTFLVFLTWAWISKRRTERLLDDPDAPKSSLAKDGPGPNPATAPRGDDITPQGDRA